MKTPLEAKHLYPTFETVILDPATGKRVPPGGIRVRMAPFWVRRLADGDMTETKPAELVALEAAAAAKAAEEAAAAPAPDEAAPTDEATEAAPSTPRRARTSTKETV